MDLDTLIYDPERLACSAEEKEACLETVRKLVQLCKYIRRNGLLSASLFVEKEDKNEVFFRACLLEFEEYCCEPAALERILCAYLAAGNYRGADFLNAVLILKGLLLLTEHLDAPPPSHWGKLLSAELRGFFGAEYRERVMKVIGQETKTPNTREASFIPEFDRFVHLDLPQRQDLIRKADIRYVALALSGAGAAAESALLEALDEEVRTELEEDIRPYTHNLRLIDVTQAQEALLKQWGLVKPDEVLKPVVPETDSVII